MSSELHSAPGTQTLQSMPPEAFDELDAILDDVRIRIDETPQWEFCEGFMAALICCRRPIASSEYFEVLLGQEPLWSGFADAAQQERFASLWSQRWEEVQRALDTPVESLEDEAAYHPEVLDVRGSVAQLEAAQRAELGDAVLPAFAQVWALGFMFAVENWPEEWAAPRDRQAARWLDASMQAIVALTEDDEGEPTVAPFGDDSAPSVSESRIGIFADAVWAVYDLRELWRSLGPRVAALQRPDLPGRNDPCHCGSGKKFKKCCGS